jgi:hypothetical protein
MTAENSDGMAKGSKKSKTPNSAFKQSLKLRSICIGGVGYC